MRMGKARAPPCAHESMASCTKCVMRKPAVRGGGANEAAPAITGTAVMFSVKSTSRPVSLPYAQRSCVMCRAPQLQAGRTKSRRRVVLRLVRGAIVPSEQNGRLIERGHLQLGR